MIELEAAQQRILDAVPIAPPETIPLTSAHRRILAETPCSLVDLPPFDNSAMDGYAVRCEDLVGATKAKPIRLRLSGTVAAGAVFDGRIGRGQCIRLFTGSPLPSGADAVILQEDTIADPVNPDEILFTDAAKPWEHVRLRGVDVKQREVLCAAGEALSAGVLNLLAAAGQQSVKVGSRPRVTLLATGTELREPGGTLKGGQIYESNRVALAALTHDAGGLPQMLPIVGDSLADTRRVLERAFTEADLVVTSGGVSVGDFDFVKQAFCELGGEVDFWKVAMRPGKPFVFGKCNGRFLFGLPGNPVSAFVTFLLLVRPAIRRWQGATCTDLPRHSAQLAVPLSNPENRRHFVRVTQRKDGQVRPAGLQASHALKSLAAADGLVEVPPGASLPVGTTVRVWRWD